MPIVFKPSRNRVVVDLMKDLHCGGGPFPLYPALVFGYWEIFAIFGPIKPLPYETLQRPKENRQGNCRLLASVSFCDAGGPPDSYWFL